ncbi:MAG: HAD family hydrolase [Acidobacteriota bacterium]|nr:HAD family hydrolase [Acidobacteriota bacterium]MDH3786290.1 HAD family hydrolase [Acidobacteriota bacterium]
MTANDPTRIAMWSGPRNISTALLRSWGSRTDTHVCDEPLYAHYLKVTGLDHPGRDAVLAGQPTEWQQVVRELLGPTPGGRPLFYQKHMAHHLLPDIGRDWLRPLRHAFLIRDPREMLTSLHHQIPEPTLEDTGLPQQWELFAELRGEHGQTPPVIDSRDVLEQPGVMLERLCQALDVPYDPTMLTWEAGRRETDGVWAPYWYDAVERSTGFQPYRKKEEPLPASLDDLLLRCQPIYDRLHAVRLRPTA